MFKTLAELKGGITRHRRALLYAVLLSCVTLATSCFGGFPMTRAVYNGNRNVYSSVGGDNTQRKMAQSVVLWLFIPVYAGAAVGDMVVFNLIEFWTGSRTDVSYNHEADGTTVALTPSQDGRQVTLTVSQEGKIVSREHFVKVSDREFEVRNPAGRLDGKVTRGQDGSLRLTDSRGVVLQNISTRELAALGKI